MRWNREWNDEARTVASTGLVVVATLLLVVGGINLYARETIFDPEAFTDRATSTLRDDEVRNEVTRRIVDQIIDKGSAELLQAKPLLETVVDGALDTGAFRGLFRKAALNLHRLVFERDRSSLVFDLADAGTVVIGAAKAIAPSVAKEIPPDIEPALVNFGKRDWATGTLELAEDVRILGVVLPILAILLFAGSIAAGPDRRSAVGRVGAAMAVGSGVCVAILLVGRSLALGAIEDDGTRGAADAAWDVFAGDLSTWALAVGAGGLVLAAAAHSILQPFDVSGRAERLQDLVTRRPVTKTRRLGRGVAILALSLFVVVQPTSFLRIVTIVVGAYGLFFATSEVLAVVARPHRRRTVEEPEEPEEPERPGPLASRRARAAAAGVTVLAVGLVLLAVFSGGERKRPPHVTVNCNGFRQLCDRPLNQVAFPATHNSMSAADEPGWFFGHHTGGISSQLEFGVRGFLIDAHYGVLDERRNRVRTNLEGTNRQKLVAQLGEPGLEAAQRLVGRLGFGELEGKKRPYLCHALCELGATDMVKGLRQMRDFLHSHPDEVLIVFIEDYVTPADIARTFDASGLRRYAFTKARDEPWPTLRQMIRSNRRVLVMLEKQVPGARYPWLTQGFEVTQETPYAFKTRQEMAAATSCRPNRGGPDAPLFQLNHWIERVNPSPGQSEDINSYDFLLGRAQRCQRDRGLLSNLVAVNFYDRGDLLGVSNVLNGLPRAPRARGPGGTT